jgi:hypothetical protein
LPPFFPYLRVHGGCVVDPRQDRLRDIFRGQVPAPLEYLEEADALYHAVYESPNYAADFQREAADWQDFVAKYRGRHAAAWRATRYQLAWIDSARKDIETIRQQLERRRTSAHAVLATAGIDFGFIDLLTNAMEPLKENEVAQRLQVSEAAARLHRPRSRRGGLKDPAEGALLFQIACHFKARGLPRRNSQESLFARTSCELLNQLTGRHNDGIRPQRLTEAIKAADQILGV